MALAVAPPVWKLKLLVTDSGVVLPLTLSAEPVDVLDAVLVENTGWSDRAEAVPVEVLVEVEADPEMPLPSWNDVPPLATVLSAVAVVVVAAEATPATISAAAATAAKRKFRMR